MKKTSLLLTMFISLIGVARAETITQYLNTGVVVAGIGTESDLTVNKFDSSLGTLTKVTMTVTLATWGGYSEVLNISSPTAPIDATLTQGVSSYLTGGMLVGNLANNSALDAIITWSGTLSANGDSHRITGADVSTPTTAGPLSGEKTSSLDSYITSSGETYVIKFFSSNNNVATGEGGVQGTYQSASSTGYLTVVYEYSVPEPTSLALFAFGCVALGLRRRNRFIKKA